MTIKVHDLKLWTETYDDVEAGRTPIQLRNNDRRYQAGDVLKLREWDPETEEYTGRVTHKEVRYVFRFAGLTARLRTSLGINPCPSALISMAILSISHLTVQASAELTRQDMLARPLDLSELGESDFKSGDCRPPSADIYAIDTHGINVDGTDPVLCVHLVVSNLFHPIWNQWVVSLIHLRDIEGRKSARKDYPQAEYELLIRSVSPDTPITVRVSDFKETNFPTVDVVVQFNGVSDDQAIGLQRVMMQYIIDGHISPDSDHLQAWTQEVRRRASEIKHAH